MLIIIHIIGLNKYDDNRILLNNINNNNIIKDEQKCRKSTINNPMSNILTTMNPDELAIQACDEKINTSELIDNNLNYNYYINAKKIFSKKNNYLNFIQLNNTKYPNDIKNIRNYLYDFNENNCKNNSNKCTAWNDVKFYRKKLY